MSAQPMELFANKQTVICSACREPGRAVFCKGKCKRCYNGEHRKMRLASDPSVAVRCREQLTLWREKNANKVREYRRSYRLRHIDRLREYQREWIAKNRKPDPRPNHMAKPSPAPAPIPVVHRVDPGPSHGGVSRLCFAGCGRRAPRWLYIDIAWTCPFCSARCVVIEDRVAVVVAEPWNRKEYVGAGDAARYERAKLIAAKWTEDVWA